jgi:hypothetical protein
MTQLSRARRRESGENTSGADVPDLGVAGPTSTPYMPLQPTPEAGARYERTLEAVSSTPFIGRLSCFQ